MLFRAFPAISINKHRSLTAALLVWSTLPHSEARAQRAPVDIPSLTNYQPSQEQRLDAVLDAAVPRPSALSASTSDDPPSLALPLEMSCMVVRDVDWRGALPFPWLTTLARIEGECIGEQGLRVLQDWLSRELIARGFITTRLNIPKDEFQDGHLVVQIVPGTIGKIRDEGGGIGWQPAAFPTGPGDALNVRDLDQAMENMLRLPGQSGVNFDLLPGARLGATDIVIVHPEESKRWHVVLNADNQGVAATGRNQVGATVAIDSPLHLYDQLIVGLNNDAELNNHEVASNAKSAAWNVPLGYASLSIGASEWSSKQTIADVGPDYPYRSRTRRFDFGIGFAPYRSQDAKGALQFKIVRRQEINTVGDAPIATQNHDITGYEANFAHQQELAWASVRAGAGVRGSLAGVSRDPGHVYGHANWNGRYWILGTNTSIDVPFEAGERRFGYRGTLSVQWSPMPIPSTEYLQLGGRYTVRGFDGNSVLSAESGWVWRNEIATGAFAGSEAYVALDTGRVSGPSAGELTGQTLAGTALGLRGTYKTFGYDASLGLPLVKPSGFKARTAFLGLSLTARI
ncbi:polypeptide-transport-associated domain-containing protein [Caballeronia choica]|uniref:Polypeptide-transport-associated domain-containing protein n=1 Tax=Caballeronia choica TaxID=326476 RepID=A0A158IUW3_9BURK|nr:ShlB/FhaC/HecB family hemolysin secretion/activation protein [Caballeronia choica]SAL60358.1 polypeptide-transport-associated domain-containing protein [Caballeronia choica]